MPSADCPPQPSAAQALTALESALAKLGTALREQNLPAMREHGASLQRELARLAGPLAHALRQDADAALRTRVAHLAAQAGAQRQAVARTHAAQQRALEILLPAPPPAQLYSSAGGAALAQGSGLLLA